MHYYQAYFELYIHTERVLLLRFLYYTSNFERYNYTEKCCE